MVRWAARFHSFGFSLREQSIHCGAVRFERNVQVIVVLLLELEGHVRRLEERQIGAVAQLVEGVQHLRLARDYEIAVVDAARGFGNRLLLPAGPLREPLPRRVPARSVVVYNAAAASTSWPGGLAGRGLAGVAALDAWWRGEPPSLPMLAALAGQPLLAVATVRVPQVVDTTAAGDSFAGAYLATRLAGGSAEAAAAAGNRLAAVVVQHRGAVIPLEAMPTG